MEYRIQRGDTIGAVTQRLGVDWAGLRKTNPHAVGRSTRTGRWFLREGATLKVENPFSSVLRETLENPKPQAAPAKPGQTEASARWTDYTIQPGDTLWSLAVKRFHVNLRDLIEDNHIDNPGLIRPGQKIRIRTAAPTGEQEIVASWYGQRYHGKPMANGERYDMHASTIAHRSLPLGTRVELKNPETDQRETAVVTDRGPYVTGRDVDLSYRLADRLSLLKKGVGRLIMRVL